MKAIAQRRADVSHEALVGRVLCHDVRDAAGKVALAKGAVLDDAAAAALLGLPWDEIHVLAPDSGDLHEEGLHRIAAITERMNRRARSRFLESSEAIRRPARSGTELKIWS